MKVYGLFNLCHSIYFTCIEYKQARYPEFISYSQIMTNERELLLSNINLMIFSTCTIDDSCYT